MLGFVLAPDEIREPMYLVIDIGRRLVMVAGGAILATGE